MKMWYYVHGKKEFMDVSFWSILKFYVIANVAIYVAALVVIFIAIVILAFFGVLIPTDFTP